MLILTINFVRTNRLRGGERVSCQPLCVRTVCASLSLRDVLCHGLEKTSHVANASQMQCVIAHRAPRQHVRNVHVVNAACCRASRTLAAPETQMQHVVIAQLEKHKWSLWCLKERKKNPSVDNLIIVAIFIIRILLLRQCLGQMLRQILEAVFLVLFVLFPFSINENIFNVLCFRFQRVDVGIIIICNVSTLGLLRDNGAISSVIQSTNKSRVPRSKPRDDVRHEGKETRSNPEHKLERKCWVPTLCSVTMLCNHVGLWQQVHLAMTKHAHRASNLANEMSILLEHWIEHWAFRMVAWHSQLSNLRATATVLLVKHWSSVRCSHMERRIHDWIDHDL